MEIKSIEPAEPIHLTKQETKIVQKMADGKSSKQIAKDLKITQRTVEVHRHNIFVKTGCKNAVHLVAELIRQKIIE